MGAIARRIVAEQGVANGLYRGLGVRHLPVINTDNVVVGILSRKELRTDWKGDSLI